MLILNPTSLLQLVTGSAVAIDVHASWVDRDDAGLTITPDCDNVEITTATTATIVGSPSALSKRALKQLVIRNVHASSSNAIIVNHSDGTTTATLWAGTLAAGQDLVYEDGKGWYQNSGTTLISHQVFVTGSGTYTTPGGVRAIKVECIGGGGAGGSCLSAATNSAGAGGGGSGGYSCAVVTSPAASYPYAVGAGGTPGAAGANPGGAGVDTTFGAAGAVCLARGGAGGLADTVTTIHAGGLGGAGGLSSAATGDVKADGQPGEAGVALAAAQCLSGRGGSSVYGGGGVSRKNATTAGDTGKSYGGGGSGGSIISGGASQQGGAGGAGLILVTEYR